MALTLTLTLTLARILAQKPNGRGTLTQPWP